MILFSLLYMGADFGDEVRIVVVLLIVLLLWLLWLLLLLLGVWLCWLRKWIISGVLYPVFLSTVL